ncbi:hypothetical protein Misp01_38550 [Microtetraspora sp. NBRC 13810]|uniref:hypothetical protein n=1 Tax=Microtetraspora sp. NBRC 13810 TaxID=3030990 RepID=UPI0024A4D7A8|nr:hypothetical protein [Microtetraspora sp. NBRC 13810]GLW08725.1 hypothetical protein Misp01_38550 [Microtetraspora sp. NBRC 13810]
MNDKIWVVIVIGPLSIIVGLVGGILRSIGGNRVPAAIQGGAVAFGATMTLGLLVASSLGVL